MLSRCNNPKNSAYHRYGGRGIKVCERWNVFEKFMEDVGDPPAPNLTIERIDNDGNYEPGNVRWATRKEQANNTRRNRFIQTSFGPMSMREIAAKVGITLNAVQKRLEQGLDGDQLLAPKRQGRRKSTIC